MISKIVRPGVNVMLRSVGLAEDTRAFVRVLKSVGCQGGVSFIGSDKQRPGVNVMLTSVGC